MAPLAVSPRILRELPADQRLRWLFAAAATGMMLTSQAVARDDVALAALPDELRDAIENDPAAGMFGGGPDQPLAMGAAPIAAAAEVVDAPPEPEAEPEEDPGALPSGTTELARSGEVSIVTEGASVELVGFHESSDGGALALTSERPLHSLHPEVETEVSDGPVVALPTRHRAGAPTSAIDLAMTPGTAVPAPVSGEVIEVAEYALYGTTPDVIIKIRSAADPSVVVTALHVADPQVAVGDEVEGGVTPIAGEARQLPFESQIDRFTTEHRGAAAPHVHIELQHA